MPIHVNVHWKRQRFVRQIAVRMSVQAPGAASMMRSYPHWIVAEHDALSADMDPRQASSTMQPGAEVSMASWRGFSR
jgi:hypothetical protein